VFLSVNIFNKKGLAVLTISANNRDVPRITTVGEMENEGFFRRACLPAKWCNKQKQVIPAVTLRMLRGVKRLVSQHRCVVLRGFLSALGAIFEKNGTFRE